MRQLVRLALLTAAVGCVTAFPTRGVGQPVQQSPSNNGWRAAGDAEPNAGGPAVRVGQSPAPAVTPRTANGVADPPLTPIQESAGPGARVTKGSGTLPNSHGQVWREYDISPYTRRVTSTNRPEQAVVDWILRETGYEAWHGEPLGILSANEHTMRVYHTPEMHGIVSDIIDRFVNSEAETHGFALRVVTIRNPNWRAKALRYMKPIPVQSPGVQGWLVAKEDAALLLNELGRRSDYREHNSPNLLVHNGQSTVISSMRQRTYTKGVVATAASWPGYQPEMGLLDEGFSLEFSPLVALNGQSVDAVIKLRLNQVEKMVPVKLDVPTQLAPNQQTQVQVPQLTMCHVHERFRWPVDQVLILSTGVVASPEPQRKNALMEMIPMVNSAPRADALLFIESRGRVPRVVRRNDQPSMARVPQTSYGRY